MLVFEEYPLLMSYFSLSTFGFVKISLSLRSLSSLEFSYSFSFIENIVFILFTSEEDAAKGFYS